MSSEQPPVTGNEVIDTALAGLRLDVPAGEHHARLAAVHEVLAEVLNPREQGRDHAS